MNLFIKKPIESFESDMKKSELKRVLGKWSLTAIGIGAIIGGGIGVLISIATRKSLLVSGIIGLVLGRFIFKAN